MILYVNACVRQESRTKRLADRLISRYDAPVEEVRLIDADFPAADEAFLKKRDALIAGRCFEDPLFSFARRFAAADEIVIAAPYWDLSFPSILKRYLEQITVVGLTFCYTPEGVPKGLCRAKRLTYVTTAGGDFIPEEFGFGYVKALAENLFGIPEVRCVKATGLDLKGADAEAIMRKAEETVDALTVNSGCQTVETEGFTMDYFRFGHGKKTLVILPGLSVKSVMNMTDAVEASYRIFEDQYTVYLVERRNELPEYYSIAGMADDTAAVLEKLGISKAAFFGASQGGMIAMEIACRHPELVDRLIVGSSAARVSDDRYEGIDTWIRLAESGDTEALFLAFGEKLYPKAVFESSRAWFTDAAKTVSNAELTRFIALAKTLKGFDITDDLRKIRCPMLVLGDTDDRVLGSEGAALIAEKMHDRPGFECELTTGYGHAAYDTAPGYRERMMKFLVQ